MKRNILLLFCLIALCQTLCASNVGLLIMATGKYLSYAEQLIVSAEKHFCRNHNVTYFVFTNTKPNLLPGTWRQEGNTVWIYQDRLGWPYDTMHRYHVYAKHEELYKDQDFLFASDADMLFVGEVGDEILGERVATLHPGFIHHRGSYEGSASSTACVRKGEGEHYFAGGFYGGSRNEVLTIAKTNAAHIDQDLAKGIIAVWHDESHWNRYCIDHRPTLILSPSYCFPENYKEINLSFLSEYPQKLLALSKNHADMRRND